MKEEFPDLTFSADTWRKHGHEVFHAFIRNCPEIKYALEIIEYDIKTEYPDYSIIEYAADRNQNGIYVIAKCLKRKPNEKSNA